MKNRSWAARRRGNGVTLGRKLRASSLGEARVFLTRSIVPRRSSRGEREPRRAASGRWRYSSGSDAEEALYLLINNSKSWRR